MARHPIILQLAVVCVLVIAVAGCRLQIVYNRLDWIGYLYISNQVSLEHEQSEALRRELKDFFAWHRVSELSGYAELVDDIARMIETTPTIERVGTVRLRVDEFVTSSTQYMAPHAARWLRKLRTDQLNELFASLDEDDADLREEYCDAALPERQARRSETVIDGIEDWTGRLDRAQRRWVRQTLTQSADSGCAWVENRAQARAAFRTLVDGHHNQADFSTQIEHFMVKPEEHWTPEYRQAFDDNWRTLARLIVDLHPRLKPAQRARAIERLHDFALEVRELAATQTGH